MKQTGHDNYHVPTSDEFIDYLFTVVDRFDDPVWIVPKKHLCTVQRRVDANGLSLYDIRSATILGFPCKFTKSLQPIKLVERDESIDYR